MSERIFRQLAHACKLVKSETLYFDLVNEWSSKRETLALQLADLATLDAAHRGREQRPYEGNPRIRIMDKTPTLRLANAIEATANGLYSAAEVAASFANKVSSGVFPSSFNALRKKLEADPLSSAAIAIGDLQWYRKIREMRTEWTHHSSTFIAGETDGPTLICLKSKRRRSDQVEFDSPIFTCSLSDFIRWVRAAIATLDQLGAYLLPTYVLPKFSPEDSFTAAVYDGNGLPIFKNDGLLEVEVITVREYFLRADIRV